MDTLDDFVSDEDMEKDVEVDRKVRDSLIKVLKEFIAFLEAKNNADS